MPLFALATLVVNDHVLKQRHPGWVTGKLSDVAGMVFFPLFLLAVIDMGGRLLGRARFRRDRVLLMCAQATAIVFCAVKTWAPATELYEWGLGLLQWPFRALVAILGGGSPGAVGRVALVQDVTDLVAVPFVALALLVGVRRGPPRA
ncbi:hypothetical protein [Polyangium sp. 6x1]|uniref:hypothetical protein n=1 Tax=Polyangium sp. 6x1 TaxID=3042689 RepID=UPI002482F8E6|nr:hypothetical protein [Polyangium sp. 6x1]